jgi:hypothetical protein
MSNLNKAQYIKALFIDMLLNNGPNDFIIGSELMFTNKKVVADLIKLQKGETYAYEIKAQNDDFRNLIIQLEDYNKVFDYVSLVVTENHFIKATRIIPDNIGLIIVTNNGIKVFRDAKRNCNISKEEILATMTVNFIQNYFKVKKSANELAYEFRKKLQVKEINELKLALFEFLYKRISVRFSNFLNERGLMTHYEDISLLSMPDKRIIL